jgi:hypothetical protein
LSWEIEPEVGFEPTTSDTRRTLGVDLDASRRMWSRSPLLARPVLDLDGRVTQLR